MRRAKRNLIDEGWRELAQLSLHSASPNKVQTCHNFFFAGAAHCLFLLMEEIGEKDASTEEAIALLKAIDDELESFRKNLEALNDA